MSLAHWPPAKKFAVSRVAYSPLWKARAASLLSSSMPLGSESPSLYVPAHHRSESSATGVTPNCSSSTLPPREAAIALRTHMPPQPVCFTGQIMGLLLSPLLLIARACWLHSS